MVEIIISLALFFVIIGVTVDIFLSMVIQQKRILEEQELLNQTSFAIEYMSTALKYAVIDTEGNCTNTPDGVYALTNCDAQDEYCGGIKFMNSRDNVCHEFFTSPENQGFPLKETKGGLNGYTQNLLSDKFEVKYIRFILNGDKDLRVASGADLVQPRVTMLLDIKTPTSQNQQEKIIQMTVSARNYIR